MNKYQIVRRDQPDEPGNKNEMRIKQSGKVTNYITYAAKILNEDKSYLKIKAIGNAIHKAITVAEILKQRIAGLHQNTELKSLQRVTHYEPIEEGLDCVTVKNDVSCMTITLSFQPLDPNEIGYQPPIAAELVHPFSDEGLYRGRGRGGPRRGGRGRGRGGRGRGGRGRGRGGRGSSRRRSSRVSDVQTNQSQKPTSIQKPAPVQRPQSKREDYDKKAPRNAPQANRVVNGKDGLRVRRSRKRSSKVDSSTSTQKPTTVQKTK